MEGLLEYSEDFMELKEVQITKTIWIRNDGYIKCTAHNAKYKNVWRESKYDDNVCLSKTNKVKVCRLMAETFIPKTEEDIRLGRNSVDHITHNPKEININDVRNLRWCTKIENDNFPEAHENKRNAILGKKHTEESKQKISESLKKWWRGKHASS